MMAERTWSRLLARNGVDITTIAAIDAVFYRDIRKATGDQGEAFFTVLESRDFTHYIGVDPFAVGSAIYRREYGTPEKVLQKYREGLLLKRAIAREVASHEERLARETTATSLLAALAGFERGFSLICPAYSITSWFAIEHWQQETEHILSRLIMERGLGERREEIIRAAYRPWKGTARAEIQKELAKGASPKDLAAKYQFLRSWSVIWNRPLTEDWIRSLAPGGKRGRSALSHRRLIALLRPDAKERRMLANAPYIVFFKDWRDDLRRFHAFCWSFLFDAIAAYLRMERDDVGYLSIAEIREAVREGKAEQKRIEERSQGCVATIAEDGKTIKVISSIPARYRRIADEVAAKDAKGIVHGIPAQPGNAKGKVRIISCTHDIRRVREGDILVANTTHPDYLPAMHKAAAFVTNEGGIASHAAIVARERKVPCIVGTKNATSVLKDGMIVEVDAREGVVRVVRGG